MPKKKRKLTKLHRRLCRNAFLRLERQILCDRDPFQNNELATVDKLCLQLLAMTFGINDTVSNKSELNAFVSKVRKPLKKAYKR